MTKTTKTIQVLDDRDRRILALVQRDAKLPQAEIARRVGLSAAAVNERLKKLESGGVIRRFAALVDPGAVGAPIMTPTTTAAAPPTRARWAWPIAPSPAT